MSLTREFLRLAADALANETQRVVETWSEELHAEKMRLLRLVAWTVAALGAGILTIGFGVLLTALLVPPPDRIGVLAGATAFFLLAAIAVAACLRRRLARTPVRLPFLSGVIAAGQIMRALFEKRPSP